MVTYLIGDQCLKEIAASIKKAYSKDGFCYRIDGDEFCVLLKENAELSSLCFYRFRVMNSIGRS